MHVRVNSMLFTWDVEGNLTERAFHVAALLRRFTPSRRVDLSRRDLVHVMFFTTLVHSAAAVACR